MADQRGERSPIHTIPLTLRTPVAPRKTLLVRALYRRIAVQSFLSQRNTLRTFDDNTKETRIKQLVPCLSKQTTSVDTCSSYGGAR